MFNKIITRSRVVYSDIRDRSTIQRKRVSRFIDRKPFASFFIALGILLTFIILSNIIGLKKQEEKKEEIPVKQVKVYSIGKAPRLTIQAQTEKSGVIHISALAPGIVQNITKQAGDQVQKGENLFSFSTNYQGGNSFSLQRQLAQTQYQSTMNVYDLQKNLIKKQRDAAEKNNVMTEDLRNITSQSLDDTRNLITLNDDILSSLDNNISNLESTNVGGANDQLILSTKQLKSQFLAANNQAKQGLRLAEYNASSDNPPAKLADDAEDTALKQLDIQQKMLDLNKEISGIQLQIAQVNEGLMFPSAPISGTVQRVLVKVGQQVNPGTDLMIVSGDPDSGTTIALGYISQNISQKVSRLEPSLLHFNNGQSYLTYPAFVSQEPVQGSLYAVYFDIPNQYSTSLSDKGYITVDLPIGYFDTASAIPYVPVDTVYQTKEQNYLYLIKNGKAEAQTVELGNVYGGYVEIVKGLSDEDKVILDRNVIAGDKVTTQ